MSSNTYNEDDNIRSNRYNEDDNMDLLLASYHGDLAEIAYLFFKGIPNVNVKGSNGVTSLILASQQGKLDVVAFLLDRGVSVNDVMTDGKTALLMACKNGHTEIVRILMAKGADQSLKSKGKSPRDVAGNTEIVKILDSYSIVIVKYHRRLEVVKDGKLLEEEKEKELNIFIFTFL
jgi:ankyrin repeat protein